MATYEVEHSIPTAPPPNPQHQHPTRPDLSTFFSALSLIDTSSTNNPSSLPTPPTITAVYTHLADAMSQMLSSSSSTSDNDSAPHDLLENMISELRHGADVPPKEVQGVSQEFLDTLDRIPVKSLKRRKEEDATCPICSTAFLEDPYPLVVRLPCHDRHVFDLECVGPWLRVNGTCPLDRKVLGGGAKKKKVEVVDEEEDGEYDDYYA